MILSTWHNTHTHNLLFLSLSLQSENRGPSANDVIANAIAKGILNGEGINVGKQIKKPKGATKKKCKKVKVFSQSDGIPMTIAAKQKVVKKKQFYESPKKPFI